MATVRVGHSRGLIGARRERTQVSLRNRTMLDQPPGRSYFVPGLGGLRSSGAPLAQGADQLTRQAHSLSECRVTAASTAMMATAARTIASMTCRLVLMMPRLLPF
jgi:hypothetical protein